MTDLIYALYDQCLSLGMSPSEFWNCTHYDLVAFIRAKNDAHRAELKERAVMLYSISINIGSCFGGKVIPFEKLFPSLTESVNKDWHKEKSYIMKFAERYNAMKKREREVANR